MYPQDECICFYVFVCVRVVLGGRPTLLYEVNNEPRVETAKHMIYIRIGIYIQQIWLYAPHALHRWIYQKLVLRCLFQLPACNWTPTHLFLASMHAIFNWSIKNCILIIVPVSVEHYAIYHR